MELHEGPKIASTKLKRMLPLFSQQTPISGYRVQAIYHGTVLNNPLFDNIM